MSGMLLTSAEAADALQVSVSSLKRWTDEGALQSVRTPGGHRRYTPEALHAFAASRGLPTAGLPPLPPQPPPVRGGNVTLYHALARGDGRAVRRLLDPPQRSPAHAAEFFDRVVTTALHEVGERWEQGTLTVDREHRASHLLSEALDRLRPPTPADGKLALLACPPDEWHELPLRMVRLILEWSGWRTELLGAALPWADAQHAVEVSGATLMGF